MAGRSGTAAPMLRRYGVPGATNRGSRPMSHDDNPVAGMSRRTFAGRTAAAAAVAALPGGTLLAAGAGAVPSAGPNGAVTSAALGAARAGLTYLGVDALAFAPDDPAAGRVYQEVP